ncbi:hypothetical protein J132_08799 [Termitomyces sp. J132]|nr:hypothetical protein J132_08799 [Termitomyces sp. J132]
MKSRRKPHSEYLLPPRPPPAEATFQLDYGQEEASPPRDTPQAQVVSTSKFPAPKSSVVVIPTPQAVSAPKPATVSEIGPTPVPDNQTREEGEISDEEEVQPALEPPRPPSPLPQLASTITVPRGPRHSTPSASSQVPLDSSHSRLPLFERLSDPPAMPDSPAFARSQESSAMQIDSAPTSPAPVVNQDQYDKAKDIVLDLLGWGVDPEYLVDCGVTREVVYYVFTELNLRLPQNLDTNGLMPFTPEDALELQKTVLMPPPPPPVRARRPSEDSPSVLTKAPIHTPSPPPAASPAGASNTPLRAIESPTPVSTSDLHDMEQQRRQELMARKAAIASKKSKNMPPTTSSPSSPLQSNSKQSDMNVDSVEDFLKTIGSSSASSSNIIGSRIDTCHSHNVDDMDVDEIPETNTSVTEPTLSPNQPPPSSTESGSTTYSSQGAETSNSSLTETQLSEGPTLQRRVFKRPVASDFVDFEESRPPSHSSSRNGYRQTNGGMKRRPTGFASVVSQPRCIIDVSDSEGEGDGDVVMRDMQIAWRTMSPAALLEKENEIQRMREMIAQKERKLKEAKALEVSTKADVIVKREETPVMLPPDGGPSRQSRLVVPTVADLGPCTLACQLRDRIEELESQYSCCVDTFNWFSIPAPYPADLRLTCCQYICFSLPFIPSFRTLEYDSPLNWYPLLALRTQRVCSHSCCASSHGRLLHSSSTITVPDLVPLKLATAGRMLDPGKRLCQYEVPGPGVCRDEGCDDVHLSRITGLEGVEPSDLDTAEYLLSALPREWVAAKEGLPARMARALEQARVEHPEMGLAGRVEAALWWLERG